ncbi:hypothetical protein jhhlp_008774 [Lomentospora prolificans]|uniref:DUF1996 domain-containing protein n=1 Tax=Lomentospora prolificans TaxID=41688 RepID=A0A2N3MYZ5_9PEZI|nr:hypothetical protein jhhlp_008774 [Lomentospora prolificans]
MKASKPLAATISSLWLVTLGLCLNALKMSCSQLVVDRVDPLVNPGIIGSAHLHQIVGGDSFNATMDPSDDPAERSTCTTCTFADDFSNYWTAVMFFRARNGTYKRVRQQGVIFHEDAREGGITVYYLPPEADHGRVTAFKKGFRMRTGDPGARTAEEAARFQHIDYTCLWDVGERFSNRSVTFPRDPCPAGIITTLYFPPCWDGIHLDSSDHYGHVSWPLQGEIDKGAPCPETHPVVIPRVVLEIQWDTREFNDPDLWPEDGSQPFVWSFGDDVGYGSHGDYVFGWRGDALQRAMDDVECSNLLCGLPQQEISEANKCMKDRMVPEDIDGWLETLPGLTSEDNSEQEGDDSPPQCHMKRR